MPKINRVWLLVLAMWAVLYIPGLSWSHVRPWVWTLATETQPAGEMRIDYAVTNLKADTDNIVVTSWAHQLEVRYGLLERWELSVFQNFLQTQTAVGSTFGYEGWKLGTRYGLAPAGEWPVDVAVYADYIRTENWLEPAAGTAKAIVAGRGMGAEWAYNHTLQAELQANGDWAETYQAALGLDLAPWLHAAVESQGSWRHGRYAAGVTGCLFRDRKFGFTWGAVWGLNERTPDVESRMILSLGW